MVKKELPVNQGRLIIQQAKVSIKSIVDAVVELVTNSDDSFVRDMENLGANPQKPTITIYAYRKVGGRCVEMAVSDNAAGMSKNTLMEAITYSGETSGFKAGASVRGFFGRGLKEAIIALGEGKIITKNNGVVSAVRIWAEDKVYYDEAPVTTDELSKFGLDKSDGTVVVISKISSDLKIPAYPTFEEQLKKHFALREINSNPNRNVALNFTSETKKAPVLSASPIQFEPQEAKVVFDEEIAVGTGTRLLLKESYSQLDSPKNNPFALAGVLIKTEGAILENSLLGHEREDAATYFFGELDVPEIAKHLRDGKELLSPNRVGLDWRDTFLDELAKAVDAVLVENISRKRRELEKAAPTTKLTNPEKVMIHDLCKLLSEMAKSELEEFIGPPINPGELKTIEIRPLITNILVGTTRTFSLYIPQKLRDSSPEYNLEVYSTNEPSIPVVDLDLTLRPHKEHKEILVGKFKVEGRKLGESAQIYAAFGKYTATPAEVSVVDQTSVQKRRRKKLQPKGSGFLRDIKPIEDPNPTQRVYFDKDLGELRIYINFPGTKEFLSPWEGGIRSEAGRVLLGELVSEGFCRAVAFEKSDKGELYDSSIDSFNREFFKLQRKYLRLIHKFIQKNYPATTVSR